MRLDPISHPNKTIPSIAPRIFLGFSEKASGKTTDTYSPVSQGDWLLACCRLPDLNSHRLCVKLSAAGEDDGAMKNNQIFRIQIRKAHASKSEDAHPPTYRRRGRVARHSSFQLEDSSSSSTYGGELLTP